MPDCERRPQQTAEHPRADDQIATTASSRDSPNNTASIALADFYNKKTYVRDLLHYIIHCFSAIVLLTLLVMISLCFVLIAKSYNIFELNLKSDIEFSVVANLDINDMWYPCSSSACSMKHLTDRTSELIH